MLLYDPFFRKYGVRLVSNLIGPNLPLVGKLELPRNSAFHYQGHSVTDGGPAGDEFLFRNIRRPIPMWHAVEITEKLGSPRIMPGQLEPQIRSYHQRFRRYRRFKNLTERNPDQQTPVVYDYSYLRRRYRYNRSIYSEYYAWHNIAMTVWSTLAEVVGGNDRQHFIMLQLPARLPSLSQLRQAKDGLTQSLLKVFNSGDALMMLELWKWVGRARENSFFNVLDITTLRRVNIVFVESGRFSVLNLGVLDSWRKPEDAEIAKNPALRERKGLAAKQMELRIMAYFMALHRVRNQAGDVIEYDEEGTPVEVPGEQVLDGDDAEAEQAEKNSVAAAKELQPTPTTVIKSLVKPKIDLATGKLIVPTVSVDVVEPNTDDNHIDTADDIVHDPEFEKRLELELEELNRLTEEVSARREESARVFNIHIGPKEPETKIKEVCDQLADDGLMTAAAYRRYNRLAESYREIMAPVEGHGTLAEYVKIKPEMLTIEASTDIADLNTVPDKSMLKSSLLEFDERYIKHVMQRDVASMVLSIQNAAVAVTDYRVERVEDATGAYNVYTVKAAPVEGADGTMRFKLPAVEADGTYVANNVKYRLRKQRGDLPIRKVSKTRVAFTSYFGKAFVDRSQKKVNDYGYWLTNKIMAIGLDPDNPAISDIHPGDVYDHHFPAPRLYSALASCFRKFTLNTGIKSTSLNTFDLMFEPSKRTEFFGLDALNKYELNGNLLVGKNAKGYMLVMDPTGAMYACRDEQMMDLPSLEFMLELGEGPVEFVELTAKGMTVPVGFILAYEIGLENLINLLGATMRRVPVGTRPGLMANEYAIVFRDETLVFDRNQHKATLLLAGLNDYHRVLRSYSVYDFDRQGVYLNILESAGLGSRQLREIELMYDMFIDPITLDLLKEMREPTDFRGLLLRAAEMLMTDTHPDELDPEYMRIRGYERMAGAVYSELVRAIRSHKGRVGRAKHPIDLNPYAVWTSIAEDPSIALVNDINPIENLKQQEAVTYGGTGGRSSRSMVGHTREYHRNDMGTISEATVDSSDVGINIFTSADPQFTSLRGITRRWDANSTATNLLSTPALVSPCADRDDAKRVNFINIQQSHRLACAGYHAPIVRTGYESVLAHRTSDLFAYTARKDGRVVSRTERALIVEYTDGERVGMELGRRYGQSAGLTIPHDVVSDMEEGKSFKKGTVLCYNTGFFERDILNPGNVVWKSAVTVKVALLESSMTLEDSSVISSRLAEHLKTKTTKIRTIVLDFNQAIRKAVRTGDTVEAEDILCIIEDAVTANTGIFDEESLDTLKNMSSQTPKAKTHGTIERIEVFYHGDKEDMHESIRSIANASDREMVRRNKELGKPAIDGSVDEGFRVDGNPLLLDTVAIRFYITDDVPAGVGDKGVFGNQLKTVFGEVMQEDIVTEAGESVDGVFGYKSVAARITLSPELIGTTATLMRLIGLEMAKAYRK